MANSVYLVKSISFLGRPVRIVTQNVNGPCPLLSLVNILLLKNAISLPSFEEESIREETLLSLVAQYLLDTNANSAQELGDDIDNNLRQNMNDAISLLPQLCVGLDVNVRFRSIEDMEFTQELTVFDLIGTRLVHGWVVDPQDSALTKTVGDLSYNQVVERVIALNTPRAAATSTNHSKDHLDENFQRFELGNALEQVVGPDDCQAAPDSTDNLRTAEGFSNEHDTTGHYESTEISKPAPIRLTRTDSSAEATLLRDFLGNTASQLTPHGIQRLHDDVRERELAVFFRNNHFSILFKYNGSVYLLVTDQGYLNVPEVAWEKFVGYDGETEFVNSSFEAYKPTEQSLHDSLYDESSAAERAYAANVQSSSQSDHDLAVALQLEETRLEEERNWLAATSSENTQGQRVDRRDARDNNVARQNQSSARDKKSCVIS